MLETTVGQLLVNESLPESLRDPRRVLDKAGQSELFRRLAQEHPDKYREVSHRLADLGRAAAQESGGNSFDLRHLAKSAAGRAARRRIEAALAGILDDDSIDSGERNRRIVELTRGEMERQQGEIYEESLREKNPLALQVLSGSRGNKMNLSSLRGSDLLYADHRGREIPLPILRSYSEGLTPAEYWAGAYGARKSVIDTKLATQRAGFLGKQLAQLAHRLLVTDLDEEPDPSRPATLRGWPVDVDDPDNEGALLAKDTGPYERNTHLTPRVLSHLRRLGHDRILVRSPAVGGSPDGGVYARDVGVRERGVLPGRGEMVGMTAAQALAEPLSQGMLCLATGTLVRMADGTVRRIEDVVPGDLVAGANRDGRVFPVRVLAVHDNGGRDCVETVFRLRGRLDRFCSLVSTRDHQLLAHDPATCMRPVGARVVQLVAAIAGGGRAIRAGQRDAGALPTYDLEVDHPDHLFVLANGLIVSNSSKHSGGVAGAAKSVGGFQYVNALVQAPETFPGVAAHADVDGRVSAVEPAPAGGQHVTIDGVKHYVAPGARVVVGVGDEIEAGDVLSDGVPHPATVTKHKGLGEGRRYFVDAFRRTLRDSGVRAHRRNIELIARGLINHVRLTDEVDDAVPGDVLPYSSIEHRYKPREGYLTHAPARAVGHYLERPYLHYSVGTRVRPSVARELERFGVESVDVHPDPPPFEPEFVRAMASLQHDPDWMTRMYGSGLKKSLLTATHRGGVSDERGTSFVPGLAHALNFGRVGVVCTPEPGTTPSTPKLLPGGQP